MNKYSIIIFHRNSSFSVYVLFYTFLFLFSGEFRFLLTKHKILEIVHKRPVDENAFTATLRSGAVYTILDLVVSYPQSRVDN